MKNNIHQRASKIANDSVDCLRVKYLGDTKIKITSEQAFRAYGKAKAELDGSTWYLENIVLKKYLSQRLRRELDLYQKFKETNNSLSLDEFVDERSREIIEWLELGRETLETRIREKSRTKPIDVPIELDEEDIVECDPIE